MSESDCIDRPTTGVMVDIGPGHGALIILAEPSMLGEELEISEEGSPMERQHVFVLMRSLPHKTAFAAVFPRLPSGSYLLWGGDGKVVARAEVREGAVATVSWPADAPGRHVTGGATPGRKSTVSAFTQGV